PRHDDATNTVPTPAMHNGDFSGLLKLGSQYTIYDPGTRTGPVNGRYTQTPFPNNTIPSNRFNKLGKSILHYFPTTAPSPTDARRVGNYRDASLADPLKYSNLTTRWDQNIGDKQRFFARSSHYIRNDTYNNSFNNAYMGIVFWFYSTSTAFDHVYT